MRHGVLAAVCLLVIGVYAHMARPGEWESLSPNAADSSYNLLVQGFRAGQLNLKKDVPPALIQLTDPYDPAANAHFRLGSDRMHDLSYYKGKLYLYFGITPALILFWPFVALTGRYLSHRLAVLVFCSVGFLASAGVLYSAWRRYFSELSVWVVAAGALAIGLATVVPVMLPRSDVYEVAISCGYMLTMVALVAIWKALHEPERRCRWLATASLAYGLAVGARPTLLLGAVILLAPVAQAWRERRKICALLMAATGPMLLIGLGLMLDNALRFNNPFEFGQHYQLAGNRQLMMQFLSLRYLWFNFRVYFLEPARWSSHFPFVREIAAPPLPLNHCNVEGAFGVLTNIPLVWLALAAPLAWRNRSGQTASILRWFGTVMALLFGTCVLPLLFYMGTVIRYEVEFLPALLLLAVLGILGLERTLADRPLWRRAARWGWGFLLSFSVAFNLFASAEHYAEAHDNLGLTLAHTGKIEEAIAHFQQALRIDPNLAEAHYNLGVTLEQAGQMQEAIAQYEQALRIDPDYAEAQSKLGTAMFGLGERQEALRQFEKLVQIRPQWASTHYNLGVALERIGGRMREAVDQYKEALRIDPNHVEAHDHLANLLARSGKLEDAITHYQELLRLKPDDAEAHLNLGAALAKLGKPDEAITQYQKALRLQPDNAAAHNSLANAFVRAGRVEEAIEHYQQALQIVPNSVEIHYNLGVALERVGRVPEAIEHYQQALSLRPDLTAARNALARLQPRQ